ncbi:CDP-glycerol glycerophosphotransferase family protein [Quadrisphaera sp. DSM 44207]|uniref:CDP-glycerol glycerophosphotransferase family protein n=1 Tax=Quadrisphaera sp. DSM 44207 TaxID=1881057 RepID=UPI0021012A15|nr:CDP-glycerol glycerophosphotransferase family protein [Quadrisphaera sp. DSM 44207]
MVDVSAHPDIRELHLAADALVTDHSSTVFDFAITGRPVLFFAYDLEHYRDSVHGFSFDVLERDPPGPVLATSEEVVAALADLPALAARHARAHAAFRARFCHLEDGYSSQRVVERFLTTSTAAVDRTAVADPRRALR